MSLLISTGDLARGCLAGKVAIVTGGGRGIGLEASRALLWLGARVIVAEIDHEAAAAAGSALEGEWGADRVRVVPADVADEASVAHLLETARGTFGAVDVVLNNATAAPTGVGGREQRHRDLRALGEADHVRPATGGVLEQDGHRIGCAVTAPGRSTLTDGAASRAPSVARTGGSGGFAGRAHVD